MPVSGFTNPTTPGFGMLGAEFINDTAAHVVDAYAFQCATPTTLSAITANPPITGNNPVGVAFPAGFILYVQFTSITLASGSGFAFRAR